MNPLFMLLKCQLIVHVSCQQSAKPYFTGRSAWYGGDWVLESRDFTIEKNEWADYIATLGYNYQEDPEIRKKEEERTSTMGGGRRIPEVDQDWQPMSARDMPYLAVVYRGDRGRPSKEYESLFGPHPTIRSHIEPGTACGGVLLTSKHVLTSCGCILTFAARVFNLTIIFPPGIKRHSTGLKGYDIYDPEASDYPGSLFVDTVAARFQPTFKHRVSVYPEDWSKADETQDWGPGLTCKRILRKYSGSSYDLNEKIISANAEMAVLPFAPPIEPNWPYFFPRWPPLVLHEFVDPNRTARATLFSIGMRLSTKLGFEFDTTIFPSTVTMQHCTNFCNSSVCNTTIPRIVTYFLKFRRWICFNAPKHFSLYGGTIGWPVLWKGQLIGITASERDAIDFTVLVSVFGIETKQIESYVGKDLLETQNNPPPVYRETDLPSKYFIYDYGNPNIETARPRSIEFTSSAIALKSIVCCLVVVVWLFNF